MQNAKYFLSPTRHKSYCQTCISLSANFIFSNAPRSQARQNREDGSFLQSLAPAMPLTCPGLLAPAPVVCEQRWHEGIRSPPPLVSLSLRSGHRSSLPVPVTKAPLRVSPLFVCPLLFCLLQVPCIS